MSGVRVEVVAGVVERAGRFLVCLRPAAKKHGGMWEFPGGKLEPGEDTGAALVRELAEELGVSRVQVGRLLHSETAASPGLVIHFVEASFDEEPRALEHDALQWCTAGELEAVGLAPSDLAFARACLGNR